MNEQWVRVAGGLRDRVSGPMHLQPAMAGLFGIGAGWKDAKTGNPPYFWILISSAAERAAMLKDAFRSVGRVFVLALVLDVVYQYLFLHAVYPGEALIVAFLLAVAPYMILRGLVTRLVRAFRYR